MILYSKKILLHVLFLYNLYADISNAYNLVHLSFIKIMWQKLIRKLQLRMLVCPGIGNMWFDLLWWNWSTRCVKCWGCRQKRTKHSDREFTSVDSSASIGCRSVRHQTECRHWMEGSIDSSQVNPLVDHWSLLLMKCFW